MGLEECIGVSYAVQLSTYIYKKNGYIGLRNQFLDPNFILFYFLHNNTALLLFVVGLNTANLPLWECTPDMGAIGYK